MKYFLLCKYCNLDTICRIKCAEQYFLGKVYHHVFSYIFLSNWKGHLHYTNRKPNKSYLMYRITLQYWDGSLVSKYKVRYWNNFSPFHSSQDSSSFLSCKFLLCSSLWCEENFLGSLTYCFNQSKSFNNHFIYLYYFDNISYILN